MRGLQDGQALAVGEDRRSIYLEPSRRGASFDHVSLGPPLMCNGWFREELEEVLEEWVLFRVSRNLGVPEVNGIDLRVRKVG